MSYYFGQVIPVTGLNLGFPGSISRNVPREIAARQVLSTTPNNLLFGAPVVIINDVFQSVADFIAGGGTLTAALVAGVAIRNVKTTLGFPYSPNAAAQCYYLPGEIAEVLERGSISVQINVGTPTSPAGGGQAPVYIRKTANGSIPAGIVGGFEATADGSNTLLIPNLVFRTNQLDPNNVAEISILSRQGA